MKKIYVGKDCLYKTINEAIQSINEPTHIILLDDEYYEKVIIDKPNIILDGQNKARVYYDDYAIKIHEDGREYVTFRTYTMIVKAPHVELRDLTIENNAGEGYIVEQAVALHLYADDIKVNNCHLIAHQDTLFCGPLSKDLIERYIPLLPSDERLYEKTFYHEFNNCTIEGTVDFIFGGSNCNFNNCTIISLSSNKNTWICAPDHEKEVDYGFHFNNCRIFKGEGTRDDSVYLARPWREYGYVTFSNCYLDSHIKEDGFSIWEGTDRHKNARFYEENSYGPGAKKNRISWSHVK